jgi:anthranilate phosphoribosyltransferase
MDIKTSLDKLSNAKDLSGDEMRSAMNIIMSGEATSAQIGAFLMGLRVKGETVEEIAAAVSIMREKMLPVKALDNAIDIVGTGGDGMGTLNISTATAIVVAGGNVPVAKHGNKALSSKSGSSEALQALGVKLDLSPKEISNCILKANIGFMFAPNHHQAMKYVGPVRSELGIRTIFNLLGPQSNPAGVKRYLLGVYAKELVEPIASALLANGATSAWVVHGSDGLDEITTTGATFVSAIENGEIHSFEISPSDAGLEISKPQDLTGGDPKYNAAELMLLLEGKKSAYRDIVLFNAAASFIVADKVDNLKDGVALGEQIIDSGKALKTLEKLIEVSNS